MLKILDIVPGWVYAIALGLAIGWLGVQEIRISSLRGDLSEAVLEKEQAKTAALTEKSKTETEWRIKLEDSDKKHADELASLRAELDAAGASISLYDEQLKSFAGKARNTCPQPRRPDQPGGDPIGVLADLLSREGKAANLYAEVAERRRVIAAKCERDYDALTSVKP